MFEIVFLISLGLIWIFFASIQDLKTREVANWLNFSLIIFALSFRFFYSLFEQNNFLFFYQGLIGLGIFFILGNLMYYGRMFAGGDAKLMIALGVILPYSKDFSVNLNIFLSFFIIFLFVGAIYGFIWSGVLAVKNSTKFKKEFSKQFIGNKLKIYLVMFFGIILMLMSFIGFIFELLFFMGVLIFILPYFYLFAKSIDEVCMVKKTKTTDLREGDWLYEDLRIGKKLIKARWDGLNNKEIKFIKKNNKFIMIKQGLPFVPVFLVSFLILVYLFYSGNLTGLWNFYW